MTDLIILTLGPIVLAFYVASKGRGRYLRLALHASAAFLVCLLSPLLVLVMAGRASDGAGVGMIIIAWFTWPFAALFGFFALLNLDVGIIVRLTPVHDK